MLYIYGLVDRTDLKPLGAIGLGEPAAEVFVVACRHAGALVSNTDTATLRPEPRDVLCHEEVLERVMDQTTVLPVRFGTVARDAEALCALLDQTGEAIQRDFEAVRGKVEIGVKVLWKREVAMREVERRCGDLERLRLAAGNDAAKLRQTAIEVGRLVEEVVLHWREEVEALVARELDPLCDDRRSGKTYGLQMLLNLSLLAPRTQWREILRKVDDLDRRLYGRFTLKCVAPLPPHSFVTTRLTPPEA